MEEQGDPKKALQGKPGGRRKRGKPRTRRTDNVEDAKNKKVKQSRYTPWRRLRGEL
jgi:hypothetical protein